MNDSFESLMSKFIEIKNMHWIKSKRFGTGGIGYTFEKLLGKDEDNFCIPDYEGIEIKTCRYFTKGKLALFSAAPDGDFLFPMERIVNAIGYPDKQGSSCKVLNITINAVNYKALGYYKRVKVKVDSSNEKVSVLVTNSHLETIDVGVSWSFDLLETKLLTKLNYLALIKAHSKKINNIEYFYYDTIAFYKLKNFDQFLKALKSGYISISFKVSVFRKGPRKGKMHDRGTNFIINIDKIETIFEKIDYL